jgi:hypothetical protein
MKCSGSPRRKLRLRKADKLLRRSSACLSQLVPYLVVATESVQKSEGHRPRQLTETLDPARVYGSHTQSRLSFGTNLTLTS